MAKTGEVITNAVTGFQLKFVKTAEDTNGEYLEVEQIVKPDFSLVPPHRHMVQTETFHILSGVGKYIMNGKEGIVNPGEEISFAPGTSHKNPFPADSEDLQMRVTITPALDFHVILETLVKAAEKGDANPDGSVTKLHSAVLLHGVQSKSYAAAQPVWLQKAMFPVLAYFGRRKGLTCGYADNE